MRFTTFVVATIPTFWLKVAVGSPPKNDPKIFVIPYAIIPPDSSLSVGSRSSPPPVVAEKSPIACTELITKSNTIVTIEDTSNFIPKYIGCGIWNIPAEPTAEKSIMPKNPDTIYPTIIPIKIDASFKIPFAKWFSAITTASVINPTSQFCHAP